jgi:hypothetical protein
MLLARSIFSADAVLFVLLSYEGVVMLVSRSSLPDEAVDAAGRIAARPGDGDPLHDIATHLLEHGAARVATLADSIEGEGSLRAAFPPVIVLDADPQSLSADLERAVPRIHDRMWDLHVAKTPMPGGGSLQEVDDFEMDFGTTEGTFFEPDRWMEGMSETGEPVIAGPFGAYGTGDWHRVRQSVLAVAQMIENRVAPGFVGNQGRIGVEVLPVLTWRSGQHRIRATAAQASCPPSARGQKAAAPGSPLERPAARRRSAAGL